MTRGREAIREFLGRIAAAPLRISIDNEVIGDERLAFTVAVTLDDGRRIVENVVAEHRDGRIVRQIDVEAWD